MAGIGGMQTLSTARGLYTFDAREFGVVANDPAKASANVIALQAAMDAAGAGANLYRRAEVVIPHDGPIYTNAPVFVPKVGVAVRGEIEGAQICAAGDSNVPQLVVGVPRGSAVAGAWSDLYGKLDVSVAPSAGVAYGAVLDKVALIFRGTPLDLGPPRDPTWSLTHFRDESQYTIAFALVPNPGGARDGTVASFGAVTISIGGSGTVLTCKFKTSDGVARSFAVPITTTDNVPLKVVLQLDLNAGKVAAYVGNVAVAVNTYSLNYGWTAGGNLRLDEPGWAEARIGGTIGYVLGGFKLHAGLLYPIDPSVGGSIGSVDDSVYGKPVGNDSFAISPATSSAADFVTWRGRGAASTSGVGLAVPPDLSSLAATGYLGQETVIRDLQFVGHRNYGQGILYGCVLDLRIDGCRFRNGANGIAGVTAPGSYPVNISRCSFMQHGHSAIHLGWGVLQLRELRVINVGRYAITTHSQIDLERIFTGEGSDTRAVIRGFGLSDDGSIVRIVKGELDFESFTAGAMLEFTTNNTNHDSYLVEDVAFCRVPAGKPAVKITSPPAIPLGPGDRLRPAEIVFRGSYTGRFVNPDALAVAGVTGSSTRVRYDGPYEGRVPLAAQVGDATQPTWSGFAPGWEPTDPALGGTVSARPPAAVVGGSFGGLATLPGLKGRYRAGFQGNAGDALGATLHDDTTGSGGRAAVDLVTAGGVMPTLVLNNGKVAMRFLPGVANRYDAPAGVADTTLGATIFVACRNPRYAFRGSWSGGLCLDLVARLGSFTLAPSINPKNYYAVYALRYNTTTHLLDWWINGKPDVKFEVRDPAIQAAYKIDRYIIGGSPETIADVYEVIVCFGSLNDQTVRDASYQLMNDYEIYG